MLFKEIIPVYAENNTKPTNTKRSVIDWQSRGGTFSYLSTLKG
jgi:hypothetical protein